MAEQQNDVASVGERDRRWPAIAAYVLLGLVLLGSVAPRAAQMRTPQMAAYQIGRSAGLLLLSLLIAYGIWSLLRRLRRSRTRWSPWILLVASFLAVSLKTFVPEQPGAGPGRATADTATRQVTALSASDVFIEIPGLRYEPMPAETFEQVEAAYLSSPEAAEAVQQIDARFVFEGRRQVGAVTTVISTVEAARSGEFVSGFFDGFEDSMEEQGDGPIQPHPLDNGIARGGPSTNGYSLAFVRENAAIFVLGGDRATADLIANALLPPTP